MRQCFLERNLPSRPTRPWMPLGLTSVWMGTPAGRHFRVGKGVTLRLVNLTLINGSLIGKQGATNQAGEVGRGGSVFNAGGGLELIQCQFLYNQAVGGLGGPADFWGGLGSGFKGGAAVGGAIYSENGQVWATNCSFANNTAKGGEGSPSLGSDYKGGGGDAFGGVSSSAQTASSAYLGGVYE